MPSTRANVTATVGGNSFFAGKNLLINGDFNINQRAFSSTTSDATYTFDRWRTSFSGGTVTYSAQTFTLGAAPVTGYEGTNFARIITASQSATSHYTQYIQRIENVRTFANQTVTLSFWAKASTGTPSVAAEAHQSFGTGGSPSSAVFTTFGKTQISTSWARYSLTLTIPSISGKTIGTNNDSYLGVNFWTSAGSDFNTRSSSLGLQNATIEIWGVQLESGSVATAFEIATGTIQGELAACQRYYFRQTATAAYSNLTGFGYQQGATSAQYSFFPTVTMRTKPSSVDFSAIKVSDYNSSFAITAFTLNGNNADGSYFLVDATIASGGTAGRPSVIQANNNSAAYIGFSAEL